MKFACEVCGSVREKYVEPSRQLRWPPRFCDRTCAGKWRTGGNHPRWSGGRYRDRDGYVYVLRPDHPHANKDGAVFEHRLVMEEHIGRFLDPEEVVHHKNEDCGDNRIENLRLFANQAEHKRHHDATRERRADGTYAPRH